MLTRKFNIKKRITAFFLVLQIIAMSAFFVFDGSGRVCLAAESLDGILSYDEENPSELTDAVLGLLNIAEINVKKLPWKEGDKLEELKDEDGKIQYSFQIHFEVSIGEKTKLEIRCYNPTDVESLGYSINKELENNKITGECISDNGDYQQTGYRKSDNVVIGGSISEENLKTVSRSISIGVLKFLNTKDVIEDDALKDKLKVLIYQMDLGNKIETSTDSSSKGDETSEIVEEQSEEASSESVVEKTSEDPNSSELLPFESNPEEISSEISSSEINSQNDSKKKGEIIFICVSVIIILSALIVLAIYLKKPNERSSNYNKATKDNPSESKRQMKKEGKKPNNFMVSFMGIFNSIFSFNKNKNKKVSKKSNGRFKKDSGNEDKLDEMFDIDEAFPYQKAKSKNEKEIVSDRAVQPTKEEKLYDLSVFVKDFYLVKREYETCLIPHGIKFSDDKKYFKINKDTYFKIKNSDLFDCVGDSYRPNAESLYCVDLEFPRFVESDNGEGYRMTKKGKMCPYDPYIKRSDVHLKRSDVQPNQPVIQKKINLNESYDAAFASSNSKKYMRNDSMKERMEVIMFLGTLYIYFIESDTETLFVANDKGQFFLNPAYFMTGAQGEYNIPRGDFDFIKSISAFDTEGEYSERAIITPGKILIRGEFGSLTEKGKIKFLP